MSLSDEILMAYADEELEPAQRAEVERAMASDPEIARRIAAHKAVREQLRTAYDRVLGEEIPARLLQAVRELPAQSGDNVVTLQPRPSRLKPALWQWTAMAASLLIGVGLGQLSVLLRGAEPFAARDGQLVARGALADALNEQLASSQDAHSPVQMGISYIAKDGTYCRTFSLTDRGSLAGLACRAPRDWQVQMLQSVSEPGAATAYRRAASALPPAIAQAAEAQMYGAPLDARGEAAARSNGWRLQPSR